MLISTSLQSFVAIGLTVLLFSVSPTCPKCPITWYMEMAVRTPNRFLNSVRFTMLLCGTLLGTYQPVKNFLLQLAC